MLRPRIIPCLLVHDGGLVKTVNFKNPKYIGDPINAVKIFNEKEVDELAIFDIDATELGKEPNYKLIEKLANQSRMPLCYGGGIKTVEQAKKVFELGIEKIALSSAAIENPSIVQELANQVGSQSVIVVLDVKKKILGGYEVYIKNGLKNVGKTPVELAKHFEQLGAGEVVINSIDNDGVMKGFDFKLIDKVREEIQLPMTILGGAGSYEDIGKAINRYGIIGVSVGSLFVYKGKYKAVLINYPSQEDKSKIIKEYFNVSK
jgi:imidazole glycerol-phosphate synthase subunit HisF